MDPLSVSASVAGLVSLADIAFRGIFKYVKAVKGAKKEIATLSAEVATLFGILTSLHLVIIQVEEDALTSVARTHHIFACQRTLEKINDKLAQHTPGINHTTKDDSWESAKIKLRWPFSNHETDELINDVERHKATLTMALTADGMTGILKILSRQNATANDLAAIKDELKTERVAKTRITIDKNRQQVLGFMCTISTRANHEKSLRLHHPGTGLWLTESDEFQQWLNSNQVPRLWFYGIPGGGKTVLASTAIEEAIAKSDSNNAIAYFYSDYNDIAKQRTINVLGSLAQQTSRQDE